ncbi:unnamed protein product, partial [Ixodes persulcatus]
RQRRPVGDRSTMASRQRHTTRSSSSSNGQDQQAAQDSDAEQDAALRRHQDDDDDQDDEDDGTTTSGGILPWPAITPPFFYIPPPYADLPELHFPFGPFGSFMDDQGTVFDPSSCPLGEFAGPVDFHLQDESVYHEHDVDVMRQLEYARYLQASPFWDYPSEPADEEAGTGEPHMATVEDDASPHVVSAEGCGDAQLDPLVEASLWGELQEVYYGPVVTNYGTVSVILRHCIRVDITVDRAVRVVNFERHCTAAISSWGDRSCVCHPCGRVLQEGFTVDMATGDRLAKISGRGVTFTALNHGLVYLVDASGTKSTTERFQNLCYDLPMNVFYFNSEQGMDTFNECFQVVSQARQRTTRGGDEIWIVAGVRIKQTPWGDVQVSRDSGRRVIWTSPTAGTVSVTTPFVKMAISCDPCKYFFVRMGQKRLSANVEGFTVRNGSQRAGFDGRGRLTLP